MIDFKNGAVFKLKSSPNAYDREVFPFLIEGEVITDTFKSVRDGVVFTNKRIIAINSQGLTGTKKDFSSLPYSKIQAFSVETAGLIESGIADTELEIYFSGLGRVKFEFNKGIDIKGICKTISTYVL
ncbi:MAG: PH domain-containing protein [Clostridia bacterium]|nr:PH domain-containing protein [Clostridia bacterium]